LGCTLFCFGLLFLLNNFYSLKKNRFQGEIQSLIIEGGEKRSANELPARFEYFLHHCMVQLVFLSLSGNSEKKIKDLLHRRQAMYGIERAMLIKEDRS